MTVRAISTLAIACALALCAFAGSGTAQDGPTPQLFGIKNGETLPLRTFTWFRLATCEPLFLDFEKFDVLEGPPELSLQYEPAQVHASSTTRDCPKPIKGGTILVTAKDVTEKIEAVFAFRVRMRTKEGPRQVTFRYNVLLFPSSEPPSKQGDALPTGRIAEARPVDAILKQAAERIRGGDVGGARDMLEAAEAGAPGPLTYALAETYDPNMLAAWGTRGVSSDVVKAKPLYRKALGLGVGRAQARIEGLDGAWAAPMPIVTSNVAINVTTPVRAEVGSRVRLPIEIRPPEAVQRNSFVRIRGLPPGAALPEGHAIAPGVWAVPLIALPTLAVILPEGGQGQSTDVAVDLMSIDGGQLAEARVLLVIAASSATPAPAPSRATVGMELPPLGGFSGSPEAIDTSLQATPLWRVLKREFPEWYAERLKEAAALAAKNSARRVRKVRRCRNRGGDGPRTRCITAREHHPGAVCELPQAQDGRAVVL
jgi:hypothetical protein